jgi:hypothetical protein
VLFTKTYGRVLAPGLSALDPHLPEEVMARSPLTEAWRTFERVLDDYIQAQLLKQKGQRARVQDGAYSITFH